MWFILALASAFFFSIRYLVDKRLSSRVHHFTLGAFSLLFAFPILALFLLATDIPDLLTLSSKFWTPLLIIWFALYPLQFYCYFQAVKEGKLSHVLPILSFIPVFTLVIAWVVLGEQPSLLGFGGISAIITGIYILNLKGEKHIFAPIVHLLTDRPSKLILVNSLSIAVGTTLDKIAISASAPLFYSFVNVAGASVVLFVLALHSDRQLMRTAQNNIKPLISMGFFNALGVASFMVAYSIAFVAYVNSVRQASILLGSIFAIVFFKERITKEKTLSFVFVLLGLFLLGAA